MRRLKYILIIILLYLLIEWFFIPAAPNHIKEVVIDNEKAYTTIAKVYYEDYMKNKDDVVRYSYVAAGDIKRETYPEYDIRLNDEEIEYGYVVGKTYRIADKPWDGAYVYEGYVTLSNGTGYESLVYSVDGTSPRYINSPQKRYDRTRCYRINDNWYYMEKGLYYYEYFFVVIYLSCLEWPHKVLIVVASIVICILLKKKYDKSAPERIKGIIKQYNNSYLAIAKAIYKDFRKYKCKKGKYFIEDGNLQCLTEPKHEIVLSDHEYFSFKEIVSKYKEWDAIYVYKYNVLFCNQQDGETLIYSVDNLRPFRVKTPDARFVFCKKIQKHWYYYSSKRRK